MKQNKCIFLDRDGVINRDREDYVYRVEDFEILEGVIDALKTLKEAGFLLVIITNQSGIAKGIYTKEDVLQCYQYLQEQCGNLIDAHYFAPYHTVFDSESLTRKPNSLMLEKAIAKFQIDVEKSWLVGDSERDIKAAKKLGVKAILVGDKENKHTKSTSLADFQLKDLREASQKIIENSK